ncbi:MAG: M20/M25/M40 family metallo-hydrolase, partial [Parvibaculaceae bacterium]
TGAALRHGVTVEVTQAGSSCAASSDMELARLIEQVARQVAQVESVAPIQDFKASDDIAVMMDAVQSAGGKAAYFGLGSPLAEVHHNPFFDFDEKVLGIGIEMFVRLVRQLGSGK